MATIRQKGKDQWHVQIRRKGWPWLTRTFKSRKHAQSWARRIEAQMDQGTFVDQSGARETTFGELIEQYIYNVTRHCPTEGARESEETRLRRILREEERLCAHAVINLEPEHFEEYRDRRLAYRQKNGMTIAPGTVKRELSILKRVIDYRKRALGLTMNPVNNEDVKRPAVNDERFNGTLRREVLNAEWFTSIKQAQIVIESWLKQYNHIRPHQSLNMRPPVPETLSENGT